MENFKPKNRKQQTNYKELSFDSGDMLFGIVLLIVGFLFWDLLDYILPGIGTTIFTVILWATTSLYLRHKGIKQNRASLVYVGIMLISSFVFFFFDGYLEKSLNLIFLFLLYFCWLSRLFMGKERGGISLMSIPDLFYQMIVRGVAHLPMLGALFANSAKNRKGSRNVMFALLGVVISIPLLCILIYLLMQSDAAFEKFMRIILDVISEDFLLYCGYFILGIPVAFYLYSLVWSNLLNKPGVPNQQRFYDGLSRAKFVPAATVYAVLIMICLVFLLFFISQATMLFSAFRDTLPDDFTYAQYARRGFFELCTVSAIIMAVIAAAHMLISSAGKTLKSLTVILSAFTILLSVTGIGRMFLYIDTFGLTRLRVYTSLFMIFLILVFFVIILRQFISFRLSRVVIMLSVAFFLLFCYGNVDSHIARYNVDAYLKGDIKLMSRQNMESFSDAAVPALYDAYCKTENDTDRELLYSVITRDFMSEYERLVRKTSFKNFNLQRDKADRIRQKLKNSHTGTTEEERKTYKKTSASYEKMIFDQDADYAANAEFFLPVETLDASGTHLSFDEDGSVIYETADADYYGFYSVRENHCYIFFTRRICSTNNSTSSSGPFGSSSRAREESQLPAGPGNLDVAVFEITGDGAIQSLQNMDSVVKKGTVLLRTVEHTSR